MLVADQKGRVKRMNELKELLLHPRDIERLGRLMDEERNRCEASGDPSDMLEFKIQNLRYLIILNRFREVNKLVDELEGMTDEMNRLQLYHYQKYKGNLGYIQNDCESALSSYRLAKSVMPRNLDDLETADFRYSIGLAYLRCGRIEESKEMTRLALEAYEKAGKKRRIADCHVNLSLCENRMKNFKDTLEHLRVAYETIIQIDDKIARLPIEFNYAYAFLQFQNYEQAIEHIENCLEYIPNDYTTDRLLSYTMLMKAHIGNKQKETARGVLQAAETFIASDPVKSYGFDDALEEYEVIKLYLLEMWADFEIELTQKVIPMLRESSLEMDLSYYYSLLVECYMETGNYERLYEIIQESNDLFRGILKV